MEGQFSELRSRFAHLYNDRCRCDRHALSLVLRLAQDIRLVTARDRPSGLTFFLRSTPNLRHALSGIRCFGKSTWRDHVSIEAGKTRAALVEQTVVISYLVHYFTAALPHLCARN